MHPRARGEAPAPAHAPTRDPRAQFDGADDHVYTALTAFPTQLLTLSLWVKSDTSRRRGQSPVSFVNRSPAHPTRLLVRVVSIPRPATVTASAPISESSLLLAA